MSHDNRSCALRYDGAVKLALGIARDDVQRLPFIIEGVDWSANTFEAQVRTRPNALGTAVSTLTISDLAYDAAANETQFYLNINGADFSSIPDAPSGHDIKLSWDLKRTDAVERTTLLFGKFVLHGSTTI